MTALSCQVAASAAATTADRAVVHEQHLTCRTAVALLHADQPEVAADVLVRGVRRQARMAGCGDVTLPALQPTRFRAYVVVIDGVQL